MHVCVGPNWAAPSWDLQVDAFLHPGREASSAAASYGHDLGLLGAFLRQLPTQV